MSGAVRPSLDDGKNNSRAADSAQTEQSALDDHCSLFDDDPESERYDCREVYRNMELESESGETAGFRCKSWDCYCCSHMMRMNLIEELDRLIEERPELRRLLTLTLDPEKAPADQDDQHRYLTDRFNALRTELNDRYDGLSYIWIREEGDSGNPHLHLLVDRYMEQSELSRLASRVGLGHIVDIRRVNARNAARYLTKYLTKGSLWNLPDGARRYGSSADITLEVRGPSEEPEEDWDLLMDDHEVSPVDGDGPLRRGVTATDFYRQRVNGGPVGLDPPD
ncbi:rolling circle replication-associated protein [Halapricum hydrolyticum]|uniref:Rep protein n=1 Tax=Halapricum hydrolyticum TaxID=2979991 RepID=A0AAE3IDP6_9EURY|nr:Rep protein [Halapricum hydrolyticum]MCU4728650.1 Rep protein [Halapricum hydrolyticum]